MCNRERHMHDNESNIFLTFLCVVVCWFYICDLINVLINRRLVSGMFDNLFRQFLKEVHTYRFTPSLKTLYRKWKLAHLHWVQTIMPFIEHCQLPKNLFDIVVVIIVDNEYSRHARGSRCFFLLSKRQRLIQRCSHSISEQMRFHAKYDSVIMFYVEVIGRCLLVSILTLRSIYS